MLNLTSDQLREIQTQTKGAMVKLYIASTSRPVVEVTDRVVIEEFVGNADQGNLVYMRYPGGGAYLINLDDVIAIEIAPSLS